MTPILIICGVVAGVSIYDFFTTRNWQQVTSVTRNQAVFEKRNKNYGAFQIRRNYNRTLALILVGMTGGVGLIYAATNASTKAFKKPVEIPVAELETVEMDLPQKQPKPEPEVVKPKGEPRQQANMQKVVAPAPSNDPNKNDKLNIDPKNAGPEDKKGNGEFIPNPPDPEPPGKGNGGEPPLPPEDPQIPDVPAEFPGGMGKLKPFLKENIVYPQLPLEEGRGGKVYLRFIVDKNGEISDVTVIRKAADCPECDVEARRVFHRMPKWTPGTKKGKPVKTYFNIPVSFTPA